MISESLKKASLEIMLLSQLKHQDRYPYEMAMEIIRRSKGEYPVKAIVVYPVLQRLEAKGYVTRRETITKGNRRATVYHIEKSGLEYLEDQRKAFSFINDLIVEFLINNEERPERENE